MQLVDEDRQPGCVVTVVTPATVFNKAGYSLVVKDHEVVALYPKEKRTYANLSEAELDLVGPVWEELLRYAREWQGT